MEKITIIKRDIENRETFRYTGRILCRSANEIRIEAFFTHDDVQVHNIQLRTGDRFVETYFSDRWYNVYEIYDRKSSKLKGLYCNVSYPAEFDAGTIRFIDLALDLLVYPDGTQEVLDKDEFDQLPLPRETKAQAEAALQELKLYAATAANSLMLITSKTDLAKGD